MVLGSVQTIRGCLFSNMHVFCRLSSMGLSSQSHEVCSTPKAVERSNVFPETPFTPWTPGYESADDSYEEEVKPAEVFNKAMMQMKSVSSMKEYEPLKSQLSGKWKKASKSEKEMCIKTATAACKVVCDAIAPGDGEELLQAVFNSIKSECSSDLEALMAAYHSSCSKEVKRQILSTYATRYPIDTLIRLHKPYGKLTKHEIQQARAHAQEKGPGNIVQKVKEKSNST